MPPLVVGQTTLGSKYQLAKPLLHPAESVADFFGGGTQVKPPQPKLINLF